LPRLPCQIPRSMRSPAAPRAYHRAWPRRVADASNTVMLWQSYNSLPRCRL
jgi:hypothetical protein